MAKCVQGQDGKFSSGSGAIEDAVNALLEDITTATNFARSTPEILTATVKRHTVRLDKQGGFDVTADDPRSTNKGGVAPVGRYYNLQLQVGGVSIAGIFLDVHLPVNENVVSIIKEALKLSLANGHFYWVLP